MDGKTIASGIGIVLFLILLYLLLTHGDVAVNEFKAFSGWTVDMTKTLQGRG